MAAKKVGWPSRKSNGLQKNRMAFNKVGAAFETLRVLIAADRASAAKIRLEQIVRGVLSQAHFVISHADSTTGNALATCLDFRSGPETGNTGAVSGRRVVSDCRVCCEKRDDSSSRRDECRSTRDERRKRCGRSAQTLAGRRSAFSEIEDK